MSFTVEDLDRLLSWYGQNCRVLPWRKDTEPYHVWVSEIMLQQTRVAAVVEYYNRFMRELPDIRALAEVPEERLLKLWEGLGYYSRARNLKKSAEVIMEEHGGAFPEKEEDIRRLPGIGPYTNGAIGSICFGLPSPAVDGNVLRVYTRFMADDSCVDIDRTKRRIEEELRQVYLLLPKKNRGTLTQSLMELGATVCVPKGEPDCKNCPLEKRCRAYKEKKIQDYPVRKEKAARRIEHRTVLLLSYKEPGEPPKFALHKREDRGLLAGLWEFPNLSGALELREVLDRLTPLGSIIPRMEYPYTHIFSHVEWHMRGYLLETATAPQTLPGAGELRWMTIEEIRKQAALPSAFMPFLDLIENNL